jgi:hypothetical protein
MAVFDAENAKAIDLDQLEKNKKALLNPDS